MGRFCCICVDINWGKWNGACCLPSVFITTGAGLVLPTAGSARLEGEAAADKLGNGKLEREKLFIFTTVSI